MLADMHTHSLHSPDADRGASVEQMALKAQELGLHTLTVTDHCDLNYWYGADEHKYEEYYLSDSSMFGSRDYAAASIEEVTALKERFSFLRCGIELGQLAQAPEQAALMSADKRLDFIIGSLHMNRGKPDFYWIECKKMDSSEIVSLLDDYFAEELEVCRTGDFDILGHLTYPMRYIVGECGIPLDMTRWEDIIREIFSTLISRGKGIEINTSGLRQHYGLTFPSLEHICLFREMGGEIITLGSDAHRIDDIGAGLGAGAALAREAGFRYTAVYTGRQPEFIRL
ncbi:MAG: histidinol-phosphatase HisJ family protein [Ruminococcus sp.]|nr:histidinol-phosphatase HisJ family protein [Ruminococcus sp.]